ncbi:hypothetical protein C7458_1184 [Williamsia muralis]|nr:hypothetical protein C7458_1184 [Williamsia marianensis]
MPGRHHPEIDTSDLDRRKTGLNSAHGHQIHPRPLVDRGPRQRTPQRGRAMAGYQARGRHNSCGRTRVRLGERCPPQPTDLVVSQDVPGTALTARFQVLIDPNRRDRLSRSPSSRADSASRATSQSTPMIAPNRARAHTGALTTPTAGGDIRVKQRVVVRLSPTTLTHGDTSPSDMPGMDTKGSSSPLCWIAASPASPTNQLTASGLPCGGQCAAPVCSGGK